MYCCLYCVDLSCLKNLHCLQCLSTMFWLWKVCKTVCLLSYKLSGLIQSAPTLNWVLWGNQANKQSRYLWSINVLALWIWKLLKAEFLCFSTTTVFKNSSPNLGNMLKSRNVCLLLGDIRTCTPRQCFKMFCNSS